MSVFKCKMCGGNLEIAEGMVIVECGYCGTTQTLPSFDNEKKINLFNRANKQRFDKEFDKAASVYESIVAEFPEESEAYWGLCLCKYGVEYIDDPKTGKKIPTCHRTCSGSILDDDDFKMVCKNTDILSEKVYRNEAEAINVIQKKIHEIVAKEDPYDIFLCYKEKDDVTGLRTEDSLLAQDIYTELVKEGYKVFYSRITLKEKAAGEEYEPYIYSALSTAKVMLAIGTKFEYYDAVWVKNEWSRFLKMASHSSDKKIIACFKYIDAYDMPKEFKNLEALDMSDVTFLKNLTSNINRVISQRDKKILTGQETPSNASILERWIQNGSTFIKLGNYTSAKNTYEKITEEYPEDYRGWWGLILVATENFTKVFVDTTELDVWFRYVKQLSGQNEYEVLEKEYIEYQMKVSVLAAANEKENINSMIDEHKGKIQTLNRNIYSLQEKIKETESFWKKKGDEASARIRDKETAIRNCESTQTKKIGFLIVGCIILLIGTGVFFSGETMFAKLLGILIMSGGPFIVSLGPTKISFGSLKHSIQSATEAIIKEREQQENYKKSLNSEVSEMNLMISETRKEISVLEAKIYDCQKYLEIGEEKISEFLMSIKCEKFGISYPRDLEAERLRSVILGTVGKTFSQEKSQEQFDVVIQSVDSSKRFALCKIIRELTGVDLQTGKIMVEQTPSTFKKDISKHEAEYFKECLEKAGAVVEIV